VSKDQRVTLWRTSWGVALAATSAFSIGYGASHYADPSIGAVRTPLWPLLVAIAAALVCLWFLIAPNLHRWPFETPPPAHGADQPDDILTGELSEPGEPAPVGTFRVNAPDPHDPPPA
jgi:hypothetical protein